MSYSASSFATIPSVTLTERAPFPAISLPKKTSVCQGCAWRGFCLVSSVAAENQAHLEAIVRHSRSLAKQSHLYRQGDGFRALYIVHSGSFKTYRLSDEGEEQLAGLFLPGDVLGIDGYGTGEHGLSTVALETASVCEIPFLELDRLSYRIPSLQRYLFQRFSQAIAQEQQLLMMLHHRTAEQRIAAWLLHVASRLNERQLSGRTFQLPLMRMELGSYLGLTLETVSRVFSKLRRSGIVVQRGKMVTLLEPDTLVRMARKAA